MFRYSYSSRRCLHTIQTIIESFPVVDEHKTTSGILAFFLSFVLDSSRSVPLGSTRPFMNPDLCSSSIYPRSRVLNGIYVTLSYSRMQNQQSGSSVIPALCFLVCIPDLCTILPFPKYYRHFECTLLIPFFIISAGISSIPADLLFPLNLSRLVVFHLSIFQVPFFQMTDLFACHFAYQYYFCI